MIGLESHTIIETAAGGSYSSVNIVSRMSFSTTSFLWSPEPKGISHETRRHAKGSCLKLLPKSLESDIFSLETSEAKVTP